MKHRNIFLIVIVIFLTVTSGASAFDRTVLFELFTSSTCPPCATTVPLIDAFLAQHTRDQLVEIAYHMNWPSPGNDPFYVNNPTENLARKTYYGVNAVPNLWCDGVLGSSASAYASYYSQREGVYAPLDIDLDLSVTTTLNVTAYVTADDHSTANNLKLRLALVAISYDIPPGSWTYTHFEYGMLDMAPDANGINFNITASQTVTLNTSFPIPSITELDNLAVVAFVQNDANHTVYNAKYAQVPLNFPNLSITGHEVIDNIGGEPNGMPEPGESCELWVELSNVPPFATATGVNAVLSTDDPDITITGSQANFPNIAPNSTGNNESDPFAFDVAPDLEAHNVTFQLDVYADGNYHTVLPLTFMVGIPEILVVDDDGGFSYQAAFETDLSQLDYAYNVWDEATQGWPSAEDLSLYELVIWHTGMEASPLTDYEQASIAGFLDAGKKLFMSSENLSDQLGATAFFQDYFHAQPDLNLISTTTLTGVTGDPISGGTTLMTLNGAYWPDSQSSIIPNSDAYAIYKYNNPAQSIGALRYAGDYALVYLAFPYECINPSTTTYTPRPQVLTNIMSWFDQFVVSVKGEGGGEVITDYTLLQAYPNPFNPTLKLDLTINQPGKVKVAVYNIKGEWAGTVFDGYLSAGKRTFTFNGTDLASGIYLVKASGAAGEAVKKVVLMK